MTKFDLLKSKIGFKIKCWYSRRFDKCEFCLGKLRKNDDMYYGGIEIKDNISGTKKRTAYVCNLCYQHLK